MKIRTFKAPHFSPDVIQWRWSQRGAARKPAEVGGKEVAGSTYTEVDMNIDFVCRRCGGRGRHPEEIKDCFLCLGKGRIKIDLESVKKFYHRRVKNDR